MVDSNYLKVLAMIILKNHIQIYPKFELKECKQREEKQISNPKSTGYPILAQPLMCQ